MVPEHAGKITEMLMESNKNDVVDMLNNKKKLASKVCMWLLVR